VKIQRLFLVSYSFESTDLEQVKTRPI